MRNGIFDLRCWESAPVKQNETSTTAVLGIVWNLDDDYRSCNGNSIVGIEGRITKRSLAKNI